MTNNTKKSEFPSWFTIDNEGLSALCYFLKKEFNGKTIKINAEKIEQEIA